MKRRAALVKEPSFQIFPIPFTGKKALMVDQSEGFTHRQNADGTFDSICHRCFRTVATVNSEDSLHAEELSHRCLKHSPQGSDDDIDESTEFLKIAPNTLDMPLIVVLAPANRSMKYAGDS